jgi:hypothetical protein
MSEIILDQNVDRINFSEVSSNYTFKQTGNKINVYDVSGTTLLVTVPVQGDVDGTVLAFSNETASARLLNGVMTLGVKTVTSTTSALSPLTTLEIERPAVKAQLNVLTHALQSQDVEKSVQLCATFSQKKYKTLFASNKAKMVELGKLLNSATLTSIAPDVSINGEQTAELSVEYAGETFHVGLVKFQGSWLFESF